MARSNCTDPQHDAYWTVRWSLGSDAVPRSPHSKCPDCGAARSLVYETTIYRRNQPTCALHLYACADCGWLVTRTTRVDRWNSPDVRGADCDLCRKGVHDPSYRPMEEAS